MSEVEESVIEQSAQSSSTSCNIFEPESSEPSAKKLKTDSNNVAAAGKPKEDKLEMRLNGILCCVVCLDLPKTAIFQVKWHFGRNVQSNKARQIIVNNFYDNNNYKRIRVAMMQVGMESVCDNGHLMCAGCFTHLLADARLKDESASCPNCRCDISKTQCSRNLAVEKAVCELPTECQFCNKELPRAQIERHMADLCEERLTHCHFARIGCAWLGPYHELKAHEEGCSHPKKSGADVMNALEVMDRKQQEEERLYNHIFDLLSFEKITFSDLQLKPYRTDEYIHKLFYETSRFSAFSHQWVVKAIINDNQRDPSKCWARSISYQLVLKGRISSPIEVHYIVLKGPFGDTKIHPRLYQHEFEENKLESPYKPLPLIDSNECNKLLSTKAFNFRLIMFHVLK